MTEDQLSKTQKDWLYDLRANFKIEKSVEMAIYNVLVDTESGVLSDVEFVQVLNVFTGWALSDHQPTFAVGEYYFDKDVNRIVKIENHETGYTEIVYLSDGELQDSVLYNLEDYFETWETATAEQIATFQRVEHFASKGRKLDEFRVGDLIEKDGELNILGNISMEEYGDVEVDGCKLTLGKLAGRYNLIQTAEELQEVADE